MKKILLYILLAVQLYAQPFDRITYVNGSYAVGQGDKVIVSTLDQIWNAIKNPPLGGTIEVKQDTFTFESDSVYTDATDLSFQQTSHLPFYEDLTLTGRTYDTRPIFTHNKDTTDYYLYWMFEVRGADINFKNLKLDGKFWRSDFNPDYGASPDISINDRILHPYAQGNDNTQMYGINIGGSETAAGRTYNGSVVTIDSCEFTGFPNSAVAVSGDTTTATISNSYFHHNLKTGAGYGVSMHKNATARITECVLDSNRHHIQHYANNGVRTEIDSNIFYEHGWFGIAAIEHHNNVDADSSLYSGGYTTIHHNTFYDGEAHLTYTKGSPYTGIYIYENKFLGYEWMWGWAEQASVTHDSTDYHPLVIGNAFPSGYTTTTKAQYQWEGAFTPGTNRHHRGDDPVYGITDGEYNWIGGRNWFMGNNYYRTGYNTPQQWWDNWLVFQVEYEDSIGNPNWNRYCSFGDADSYPANTYPADSVGFGDFNGDGVTDVIAHYFADEVRGNDGRWVFKDWDDTKTPDSTHLMVSFGGISPWYQLRDHEYPISDMIFADVDDDGSTDIIVNDGGYKYAPMGVLDWLALPAAIETYTPYTTRDFNGDGETDTYRISDE